MSSNHNDRKYHYIYKTTRIHDGAFYIGMHSTDKIEDGYFGSGWRILRSIAEHGKEAHHREILEFFPDRESLRRKEIEIVDADLLKDPRCLNLAKGGDGGNIFTDEGRKKLAANCKRNVTRFWNRYHNDPEYREIVRKKYSENSKRKYRDDNDRFGVDWTGRKHSIESRKKISESQLGEKHANFGRKWFAKDGKSVLAWPDDFNQLQLDGWIEHREVPTARGHKQSEETVSKRTETLRDGRLRGQNSPNFGLRWISKSGICQRVKDSELSLWLVDGWKRGKKS